MTEMWCTSYIKPAFACAAGWAGFRFTNSRCQKYFLSHYHSDHTTGLTTAFSAGKIYCSHITATLLIKKVIAAAPGPPPPPPPPPCAQYVCSCRAAAAQSAGLSQLTIGQFLTHSNDAASWCVTLQCSGVRWRCNRFEA